MLEINFFLIGYLMAILNVALFTMVFFLSLDVIRYLKMFEMQLDIVIAACAAFIFVGAVPLSAAIEQVIMDPQHRVGEVVLKSVINVLPTQILFLMVFTGIWAILKNAPWGKIRDGFQNKKN